MRRPLRCLSFSSSCLVVFSFHNKAALSSSLCPAWLFGNRIVKAVGTATHSTLRYTKSRLSPSSYHLTPNSKEVSSWLLREVSATNFLPYWSSQTLVWEGFGNLAEFLLLCLSFVSVGVIKYPNKSHLWKGLSEVPVPGDSHHVWESKDSRKLKQLDTFGVKTRERERDRRGMHICFPMPSSPSLLLSSLELKHRIDVLHSELGLPTSIDVINTVPCRHTAG